MPDLNLGDLEITAPSLGADGAFPTRFTADGEGTSPELAWTGVPEGTVELALVLHDPDAPLTDGFVHWALHGIDPASPGVPEGGFDDDVVVVGINEVGDCAYTGPAPPPDHGRHHYFFHLYALDLALGDEPLTRRQLLDRIDGHILEQARVVGTYER